MELLYPCRGRSGCIRYEYFGRRFLALLLYKYLEKKVNRGNSHFSPAQIIDTLKDMNFIAVSGEGYLLFASGTKLLLICEILYIVVKINYEKMR